MSAEKEVALLNHLSIIQDPRVVGRTRYRLTDMVVMAVCAVIAGCENWVEIEQWSEHHQAWLREQVGLELAHGVPAHDTFGRLFSLLDAQVVQAAFQGWMAAVTRLKQGEVVAIDGKHLRHSYDTWQGLPALQVVNAWATQQHLMLAQAVVEPGTNEIRTVPRVLEQLVLTGCIVTVDALNTQTAIAQAIVDQAADYLLPVKENHPALAADLHSLFTYADECAFRDVSHDYCETIEKGHGRIERRQCWVIDAPDCVQHLHTCYPDWPKLATLVRLRSERRLAEQRTTSERFFITSLPANAKLILEAARAHWQIENQLHWTLDVVFREDDSRIRSGHAAQNFALLRRFALSVIRRDTSLQASIQVKRKKAAWSTDYLLSLIQF
jgi:predicted transposase YbfD/YdcC